MSTMEPVPKMFLYYIQIYLVAFIFDTCTHQVYDVLIQAHIIVFPSPRELLSLHVQWLVYIKIYI